MAEWTIGEAAAVLGVSVDTVRRRVRRGTLTARRGARGQLFVVGLNGTGSLPMQAAPAPMQADAMPRQAAADTLRLERDHALELLGQVSAERDWLRVEIERRGVELAEMRRLLAAAMPALPPPDNAAVAAEMPENRPAGMETAPKRAPPWWAFWRR
jgi:excisionase family DNA binding protein